MYNSPEKPVLFERIEACTGVEQEYHRERCSISDEQKEDYRMDREAERGEKREERAERELIRRRDMEDKEAVRRADAVEREKQERRKG